ncbi:MAG: bifunctional 5,10-methylenetetrahydrofolate dehydrogenase/5,10-methenyltetrahydrofolate cyclohydrolase [Candidatus Moranbacteria bacterium]|nr:bifunctional 5,10-methylenetetrahydrofolate dehydrogenase/5,10-methenyltetrahydrofolate cyclohydrolase [Candidatus Moranbacteria bacterium]
MKLLYGKPVAEKILSRLKRDISLCDSKPGLAVILVGNDKASHLYVNLKEKTAVEIGMNFFRHDLRDDVAQEEILQLIEKLNADEKVHGIIVQLPLPQGFDTQKIISNIDPKKDADGFHPTNTELFLQGKFGIAPVFPRAILQLIASSREDLKDKKAVVVANSDEFGKIMSAMLKRENIIASYILSGNISSQLGQIGDSDIVVSAVGSPGLLRGEMLKNGSIVIDGGIEKVGDKVFGDVDFGSVKALDGFITPVPGGVGPVTIACLLENVYLAFEAQQKEK